MTDHHPQHHSTLMHELHSHCIIPTVRSCNLPKSGQWASSLCEVCWVTTLGLIWVKMHSIMTVQIQCMDILHQHLKKKKKKKRNQRWAPAFRQHKKVFFLMCSDQHFTSINFRWTTIIKTNFLWQGITNNYETTKVNKKNSRTQPTSH